MVKNCQKLYLKKEGPLPALSPNTCIVPEPYNVARYYCMRMKGTLASVSSNDEKEHLYKMLDGEDEISLGVLQEKWDDKAYWDFHKYFPDSALEKFGETGLTQPLGFGSAQPTDCVVIKGPDKKWRKITPWEEYRFICQTYST